MLISYPQFLFVPISIHGVYLRLYNLNMKNPTIFIFGRCFSHQNDGFPILGYPDFSTNSVSTLGGPYGKC